MKFKVGDRVRVVERYDHDEEWVRVGAEFVIADFDAMNSHPYRVESCGDGDWLKGDQLELVSDSTGEPRVYKLQVPEEPAGVDRVRPVKGSRAEYVRDSDGTWSTPDGTFRFSWERLLKMHPNGVETVQAEGDFEVSLDYLRRNAHVLDGLAASGVTGSHAAAVVRGALAKEDGSE